MADVAAPHVLRVNRRLSCSMFFPLMSIGRILKRKLAESLRSPG
jgi:hypothetical protein